MPTIQCLDDCLATFKATLGADVKSLLAHYTAENAKPGPKASWLQASLRASCVLLAASLETFVEGSVCAAFTHLADRHVVADKYPKTFRYWLFRTELHMRKIGVEDAKKHVELTQRLFSPVRPLTLQELQLDVLKKEFANPIPSDVSWMASLFDEVEYVDSLTLTVLGKPTKAKAAIGELAKRRNDIAHGDTNQKPKDTDVERLSKFCQLFGNQFTKDLTKWTSCCL